MRVGWILLAALWIGGCSAAEQEKPGRTTLKHEAEPAVQEEMEVLAENLQVPWSINKSGETFFISERPGTIVKVEDGRVERQKVELKNRLSDASEAGLLGFLLDPKFPESQTAYAYYTYDGPSGPQNRIVVLTYDGKSWKEERTLLDNIPSGSVHHGGRLKIGPDDKLYVSAGDAANPEIAQDTQSLGGKILRMNPDGSIPEDNPFPNSYVYSYGHRNPQGFVWLPDGTMYASEHGQSAHDEINMIEAGKNYGWPIIEGDEQEEGMETPSFQSGDITWAPSGMATDGSKLYVATLRGNAVREFDPSKITTKEIVTGLGRIRDVLVDRDYLYFVSNNTDGRGNPDKTDDKLYRLPLK